MWQVVKSDKEHGKKTMDKLLADLGIVYEQGIYPSLKEWIAKYEK